MIWEVRVVCTVARGESLLPPLRQLLVDQQRSWPQLGEGIAALGRMRTRVLDAHDTKVVVQANPGRRASVHARVDPASVAARPCFLCPNNMPAEERGVAVGDLVVLPNPFPILNDHMSIPSREHAPQRLLGREGDLLDLALALAPDMLVFYNGPQCGASAPDHFHFQAGAHAGVPLVEQIPADGDEVELVQRSGIRGILLRGGDRTAVIRRLRQVMAALPSGEGDEPMVNVVALHRESLHNVFVFPRVGHRPACYFAAEPERISASPAALEMMGVLVLADVDHIERVDVERVRSIFSEVCISDEAIAALAESIR
jgi:hypothetical protein